MIQDLLAIIVLLLLQGYGKGGNVAIDIGMQLVCLPLLAIFSYMVKEFILMTLIRRFEQIHEYIFLLAIAWCLGIAELAHYVGLSYEIGAFIAGVTLASSPIALFITERLKPLRDFFLILFFFSLGASFDMSVVGGIVLPATVLAIFTLLIKPLIFGWLFRTQGEKKRVAFEIGFRLGQLSEFSLLIAVLAVQSGLMTENVSYLIQLTTLITFAVSSYIVVFLYPTPISTNTRLRRD